MRRLQRCGGPTCTLVMAQSGAAAGAQPGSSSTQHAQLEKLGRQLEALAKGFSQGTPSHRAAQKQLQLAEQVCRAIGMFADTIANRDDLWR